MTTATAIRITAEQLKKYGWRNVYEQMVRDLNRTLEKFQINTPARLRHFLSQCAHESGLGQWTKELADGRLYEHRKGLGNVKPGDGPKFKGAGYLQLTGRSNYQKFANEMGDPRIMEGVEYVSKNYPWASAGHYWKEHNINALIDRGANVKAVTKVINGALRGLKQREEYFRKFAGLVNSTPTQGGTVTATAMDRRNQTPSQVQTYKVQQGDSLWNIAQKVHVDVNAIKKENPGMNEHNLPVGKVIKIPNAANARGPVNPPPQVQTYKVQQGDSLWNIAQKVHVDVNAIKKANPGMNEHNLPVGKVIKIPNARVPSLRPGSVHVSWINNNHQIAWNFFKSKGFSDAATAGIMGNLQQESKMDPNSIQHNGRGPGTGLAQWENKKRGGSGRWNQLVKYAWRIGKEAKSLDFQLEYIWIELTSQKINGEDNYYYTLWKNFGGLKKFNTLNIHQAVVAFQKIFEQAGDIAYHDRFKYAETIYKQFARGVRVG